MAPCSSSTESLAASGATTEPQATTVEEDGTVAKASEPRDSPRLKRKECPQSEEEEEDAAKTEKRTRYDSDPDDDSGSDRVRGRGRGRGRGIDEQSQKIQRSRRSTPSPPTTANRSRPRPSPPPQEEQHGPERRPAPATQEDKKRGRRLFGGLLNTLNQGPSNTLQQRRRLEIEKRQQERLRKQNEEDGQRRTERLAKLRVIRIREQIIFDEEVMRNRHAKMLSLARFLQTRAQPKIYYLPWKCTDNELDLIDEQIQRARELVQREENEFEKRRKWHVDRHGAAEGSRSRPRRPSPSPSRDGRRRAPTVLPPPAIDSLQADGARDKGNEEREEKKKKKKPQTEENDQDTGRLVSQEAVATEPDGKDQAAATTAARTRVGMHDDAGDVVEHAGEDMVIY